MRRAAAELDAKLRGQKTRRVQFAFAHLGAAGKRLSGRTVRRVHTRGKALIIDFAGGESIYTHNQLYRKWLLGPAGNRPETARRLRLLIETRETAALLYSASEIEVLATTQLAAHPYVRKLGVELLDPRTSVQQVREQLELARAALQMIRRAYRTGGITNDAGIARRLRDRGAVFAAFRHYVFDRPGAGCHACGAAVRRVIHSGRQLYLCPVCQPQAPR